MVMKKNNSFFFALLTILFFSCNENKPEEPTIQFDSVFAALNKVDSNKTSVASGDTTKLIALPPLMEGDLLLQFSKHSQAIALQKATGSKYANVGIVFIRPKDNSYIVVDMLDSMHIVPLDAWVGNGVDGHVAVMRLKNSNRFLGNKKTDKLRDKVKSMNGLPNDAVFSWSNEAYYSSEFAWKMYHDVLGLDLCELSSLSKFSFSDASIKKDPTEKAISPDDLYHAVNLEIVFER
jgi:hypothetical protein